MVASELSIVSRGAALLLWVVHAGSELALNVLTPLEEYEGDDEDDRDDEEPDQLGSHALLLLVAELALPAIATDALSVATLAAV